MIGAKDAGRKAIFCCYPVWRAGSGVGAGTGTGLVGVAGAGPLAGRPSATSRLRG